jgi:hypothetical protein
MWRGFPIGTPIDSFSPGVIDVLLQRGLARKVSYENSNLATHEGDKPNNVSSLRSRSKAASQHRGN